jgi:hypothetical protein
MPADCDWSRRDVLRAAAAASLAGSTNIPSAHAAVVTPADRERIRRENELPGTRDWIATKVRIDPKTRYRCPWIEGYASRTSVRPGETIAFHVSTNPPSPFTLTLYRMGYYQGHGARMVMKAGPILGTVQPDPPIGPMRVRECDWEPNASITIPATWTSGVYLGKLTAEREGLQRYVIFVVRDDREADFYFRSRGPLESFRHTAYGQGP